MLFYDKETLGLNNYSDVDELQCSNASVWENYLQIFFSNVLKKKELFIVLSFPKLLAQDIKRTRNRFVNQNIFVLVSARNNTKR